MSRLSEWWSRIRGRRARPAETVFEPARSGPKPAGRPAPEPGKLTLADESQPKRPSRVGEAGFDPYASDAGFAKPHSWERVDHD